MDIASLILFLILYYVRLQEWPSLIWLQKFKIVTFVMLFAIWSMFTRNRGLKLKDFFKTPHDWLMLIYCLWMVLTSTDLRGVFGTVYPLYLFYVVTVQALSNMERIRRFLNWWTIMILVIAGLGVISPYGFDPTGANQVTHDLMKGRLALGTSIFKNPNAFGHGIVPSLLMLYFLFIWKRPVFIRIGAIPLFLLPIYCIYLTSSKGAFISAFATIVAALTFGRPKLVQVLILGAAITAGWAGVKMLPRMEEMETAQSDQAIRGRLMAFEFGLENVKSKLTGIGKDNFISGMWNSRGIHKAAHSSYVQVGCELGWGGFFLFIAIFYCSLRTLFTSVVRDSQEERVRRILFAMIISYMLSSWMVDWAYRAVLFMLVASIAAFHRILLVKKGSIAMEDEETAQEALNSLSPVSISGWQPASVRNLPTTIEQTAIVVPVAGTTTASDDEMEETGPGITWNHFGFPDFMIAASLTYMAIIFWEYIIKHI